MSPREYLTRLDDIDAAGLEALAKANGRSPEEQLAAMVHEELAALAAQVLEEDDEETGPERAS